MDPIDLLDGDDLIPDPMTSHRACLIRDFRELCSDINEGVDYIPDCEIEFLVREMAMMLEYIDRHIDEEV
jgi:hypothetical protein